MEKLLGKVVFSTKGRDKGKLYIVISILDNYFVQLCDGDKFKFQDPKRKNVKHIKVAEEIDGLSIDKDVEIKPDDNIDKLIKCHIKEVRLPNVKK